MAKNINKDNENTADREIIITRVFDAPRELVFDAWTDSKHVDRWWGPNGFVTTTHSKDFRPGGAWRFLMRGPDGQEYPNKVVYKEIVRPSRLAYSHGSDDDKPAHFEVTVTFQAIGTKTKVTLHSLFPTAAARDFVVREVRAIEGGNQTLDRFGEQLAKARSEGAFVISRVFDAPRELVWQAWTEAGHMARWWGPAEASILECKLDLRPGGLFHYLMRHPKGLDMWGRFLFQEIAAPERLVFINSFSDAEAGLARAPFTETWPLEVLSILTLAEEGAKTKLTMECIPIAATEAERATFDSWRPSMDHGWAGTMDRLSDHLAGQSAS